MSEAVADLLKQYRELSESERDLFEASLHEAVYDPMEDPEFLAELDRRVEAVGNGTAVLIDGDEAFRQIRERLRLARLAAVE